MGMDLYPRNKALGEFTAGAFFWPWMLESGVGLPVGYGKGFMPGQYLKINRPDGLSLAHNDGARVTAREAKQMAQIARWVASYQDALHAEWERMPESERQDMDALKRLTPCNRPVRRYFVARLIAFADWAEQSGGFRVR
ncbi:hypothetical protein [Stenotrophomonas sp.]|uniref:hypothetical protein n=1 Tax=Stenotrophomonas sp. TaxID=69392 RepID=UPI0028AC012B|nr:hypothetical protein [Stenotrophomonas sp.]